MQFFLTNADTTGLQKEYTCRWRLMYILARCTIDSSVNNELRMPILIALCRINISMLNPETERYRTVPGTRNPERYSTVRYGTVPYRTSTGTVPCSTGTVRYGTVPMYHTVPNCTVPVPVKLKQLSYRTVNYEYEYELIHTSNVINCTVRSLYGTVSDAI